MFSPVKGSLEFSSTLDIFVSVILYYVKLLKLSEKRSAKFDLDLITKICKNLREGISIVTVMIKLNTKAKVRYAKKNKKASNSQANSPCSEL